VTSHKKQKKHGYPTAPRKFIILQAGPSVTYPWVGHGKVHKAPYLQRPLFPSFGDPAPAVPAYQAVASYDPAPSSYAADVPQYPTEPDYAPAAPSYVPAAPSYAPAPPSYAPAAPEYAPAAPSYAPVTHAAAPQYAPVVPGIPDYAAAPAAPQYDPLPAPVYAEDVAAQPYAAPEGFPSFNDIAPSDVIVEPIISYNDAGFSDFDGPEPRPLEEEPIGWGVPEGNLYEAEETIEDDPQEYETQEQERYAEPEQDVAVAFDQVPVYGEAPGDVDETPDYAEAPETYVEAPADEEPEYAAAVAESKAYGVRINPRGVNFRK